MIIERRLCLGLSREFDLIWFFKVEIEMQDETSGKDIGVDLDIEILKWQETGMSPPMNGIDCCRD